ncbi:toxin-antitoxin system YwqK family antitoxin [Candidatus Avelusimicrobium caledoniensis]|uniref:toxin-antitoxin system YwqK family antitoxin n=1 Tax=Candidatus Avelusimicrobium caledoniensis TaxID=3416220 RepID=UPI003D12745D
MTSNTKEKIICITSPVDRTYYRAMAVAKEFVDREQNVVNTVGTLPDGEVCEFTVNSLTVKHLKDGKLNGKLEVRNLTDGTVSFSEEYENGVLKQIQQNTPATTVAAPKHEGTTLKTSKGTHSFYCNGKEVAEETISSNGISLELLGNIPDGEVKEFNEKDQVITIAHYKSNKLNGELIRYTDTGQEIVHENYENGFLQGDAVYFTFTQRGTWTTKCSYKNSRLNGERTLTQQNGTLRCREFYKNGHLSGPRVCYYSNGNKEREENYSDGKLSGKREMFFVDGKLWYRENYTSGRLDGERLCFFPNGKVYLEEFYADGLLEGHRNMYNEEGSLLTSEEYHWGSLVHNTERKKL